ncbi:MAG TPA: quinoprotein dehydrogenase-associated SoxYZ-like carrier [Methylocystis sp.]|nr:quinoprotein dehydrogenase-associated SoxYZ-like carrier [Methylocystis sp.]
MSKIARLAGSLAGAILLCSVASASAEPADDPWPGLVKDLFQSRQISEDNVISLDAPKRAEDASIVPMTLRFTPGLRKATLVIDQNPMPMSGAFALGENSGVTFISTRVRVNSYTNVHAVAETADGALHAQVKFVKAAGGCSAPASKNADEANAHLGEMKYREFKSAEPGLREAQIMIRHPNSSGMQMDQLTHLYIPARYIEKLSVRQGDATIFTMEGGISLSENPTFRFTYAPNGAKTITVEARDSKGEVFRQEFPAGEGT